MGPLEVVGSRRVNGTGASVGSRTSFDDRTVGGKEFFTELAYRSLDTARAGDAAANWVAQRQHGLISTDQARVCGLGAQAVGRRRRQGSWRSLHPGVYLVGTQAITHHGRAMAAVLRCAPDCVASHRTAGWLWGLTDRLDQVLDVTMLDRRNPGAPTNVRVHRPVVLRPETVQRRQGIPASSATDTLLELAGGTTPGELEACVALALAKRFTTVEVLRGAIESSPRRPGIQTLRALVGPETAPRLTRSPTERRMLALVRAAELPAPESNVIVGGKEVDLYWPDAKLVIETDAFGTHGGTRPFENDREVDVDLKAANIEVLRFTRRRIAEHPHAVVARLAAVLALRMGGLPAKRRR